MVGSRRGPFSRARQRLVCSPSPVNGVGHHPRRGGHRLDDLSVAGAPAQVACQRLADLRLGRVGVRIQQCLARNQQSGRTEPALNGAVLNERPLERVQLTPPRARRESLYREDVAPVDLRR